MRDCLWKDPSENVYVEVFTDEVIHCLKYFLKYWVGG